MTVEEKNKKFMDNMGLVYKIVNNHWGTKFIPKEDLLQEGFILLMECLERYNPNSSAAFSTYATVYIRGKLNTIIHKYMYGGAVSTSTADKSFALVSYMRQNNLHFEEACKRLCADNATRSLALILLRVDATVSLDEPLYNDGDPDDKDSTYLDTLLGESDFTERKLSDIHSRVILDLCYTDFVEYYTRIHSGLDVTETKHMLYLFLDTLFKDNITQVEVARQLGVTPERVRVRFNKIAKVFCAFIKRNRKAIFTDDTADFDINGITHHKIVKNIAG